VLIQTNQKELEGYFCRLIEVANVDEKTVMALFEKLHKGFIEVLLAENIHDPYQHRLEVLIGNDFVLQMLFELGKQGKVCGG